MKLAARGSLKIQDAKKVAKNRHLGTIAQLCRAISSQLRHIDTRKKILLSSNISSTCLHNMVNFGPLAVEIGPVVWDTPANFNGFRVLAALLHGTVVVGVSQTLRRWTEGATYIRQGGHHVGHWPTFLVVSSFFFSLRYAFFYCAVVLCCSIIMKDKNELTYYYSSVMSVVMNTCVYSWQQILH